MYIMLFVAMLMIVIGILIRRFRFYWLISGYNTMTSEEKKNVDIEGLARVIGNYCYSLAALFIITAILYEIGYEFTMPISIAIVMGSTIWLVIKAQSFDSNSHNADGSYKTKSKVAIGGLVITTIIVGVILLFAMQPATIELQQQAVTIHGFYGETLAFDQIAVISLEEQLPAITWRTNGSSTGSILKGNFKLEQIGAAKLFINKKVPPFISIVMEDGRRFYFNTGKTAETVEMFNTLEAATRE